MIDPAYCQAAFVAHHVQRILDLREVLVRMDENLAAWHLLSKAVPHFCLDDPHIEQARDEQYLMTRHVLPREELRPEDRDTDPYEAYYRSNVHENRFEHQYGIPVTEAHRLHRVQFLLDGLQHQTIHGDRYGRDLERAGITQEEAASEFGVDPSPLRVLDLSANDGFMAARLSIDGYPCDCLDLHPGNCEIARERKQDYPLIGRVEQGALEMRYSADGAVFDAHSYDAVVLFETVEHVRNPTEALRVMRELCKPDGRLYVSTPHGSVTGGNLPTWAHVEPKGHVRVFREQDFRALLEEVGEVEELVEGPDRVLVARVWPNA